ncbi:FAD/NAD(P)-binding domain-containing protein [Lophiostoma macrostomum CBS 122681]|uniref:FAD/NAD(P)-binding domain-containing protein n=1 Tax=Lophiostoma macrostomum CBS 122681 TaxID=1314788 RepID=A0A6A6T5S6_9PLEO|nr:FAD/NAD(P)-binding domain-containing protein [Lophiostoma macrostomum CBS 122681]
MGKSAVVIGGSLAGLMHGIMLGRHGYDVTILELEDSAHVREGFDAGIRAGPHVLNFLSKYDRTGRKFDIPATGPQFIKKSGDMLFASKTAQAMSSWGLLMSILRANFDGSSSKAVPNPPKFGDDVPKGTFKHGARVISVEEMEDNVRVEFEDTVIEKTSSILGDLVIVADGANSSIRRSLVPGIVRQYAGYVSWRGTIKEDQVPVEHRKFFQHSVLYHFMDRSIVVGYVIPTDDGDLEEGKRLYNFVWYTNLPEDSPQYNRTMTDKDGKLHHGTVPRGSVRPDVWEVQRQVAKRTMPPFLATVVENTPAPFVTKVHNASSTKAVFFHDKLFIVGDALFGLRPHIGEATNQAAYHCELMEEVVQGKLAPIQWEHQVLRWGHAKQMLSIAFGALALGTKVELAYAGLQYLFLLIRQRLGYSS